MSLSDLLPKAQALDAADPLGGFRARFHLPEGVIYLDGNSLGPLPRATPARLSAVVERQWADDLIGSWNVHGWIDLPASVGAKIAPLIGAEPHEVLVADSTSVNLFKLLAAALARDPARRTILSEPGNFPTDLYVAQGAATLFPGARVRLAPATELASSVDGETATVLLTHVHYKTGAIHDMAAVNAAAREAGALTLWDLSHSVGAVEVDLRATRADLAVGCGYKHLNGGPGAPAFLYVREGLQAELSQPVWGWLGHAAPFAFEDAYTPATGLARFRSGTPPVPALAMLDAGVELVAEAGMAAIVAKRAALSDLFVEAVETLCAGFGLELVSPREASRRGGHVAFAHPHGYAVMQALIARGVVGDFRAPDILRFGITPLYTRFEEAVRAAHALAEVLATRAWDDPRFAVRAAVT